MANKAKHAFGMLENIDAALSNGAIDSYDILFVKDANGKPYVGWIDKDGNKVICNDSAEFAKLETVIATKVDTDEVEAKYEEIKYEIADVPTGTLINYRDGEIRICCPADTVWTKQTVGEGGDANTHYFTLKTYAPDDAVGYIEHLGDQVDKEILTDLKTDVFGRRYQPTWLGLAKYNESTDTWTYYGANSTVKKYIGWDYQIDWFNADGIMIASDSVRINLSNADCHSTIEPYYVNTIETKLAEMETKIEEVSACEIIEF